MIWPLEESQGPSHGHNPWLVYELALSLVTIILEIFKKTRVVIESNSIIFALILITYHVQGAFKWCQNP